MSMHYETELQDALDGRLDAPAQHDIEAHLAMCSSCRAAYEQLRWVKAALAPLSEAADLPSTLPARIQAALDREDGPANPPVRVARPPAWRGRWVAAVAAAALVIVGVTLLVRSGTTRQDVIVALADDFDTYRASGRVPKLATDDAERLRSFFTAAGLGFEVRVLDLSMMGYRVVGGSLETVAERDVAVLVYRSDRGRIVLCAMYLGNAAGAGGEVHEHAGIRFHLLRLAGRTAVVWQEGRVTCALVADGEPQEVLRLAIAKAMKA